MSILDELVTNRTAYDVAWVAQMARKGLSGRTDAENAQWLRGYASEELVTEDGYTVELQDGGPLILRGGYLNGAYNYTDMNRVENAVKVIYNTMSATFDYLPAIPTIKTNWKREDIPTQEDVERYIGNLSFLKNLIESPGPYDLDPRGYFSEGFPNVPENLNSLDYLGANQIETLLAGLYKAVLWLNAVIRYGDTHTTRTWTQVEAAYQTWSDIEGVLWPYVSYGEDFIENIPRPW